MLSVTEGYGVSSDWQQAIHDEQKDSVAKDEGHLESRPVHSLGRQQEAKEVNCDEKGAWVQEVYHIHSGPAPQSELWKE